VDRSVDVSNHRLPCSSIPSNIDIAGLSCCPRFVLKTIFDQHRNNFDFLRLALSILVIFSHSYPLGTGSELVEPFNLMTRYQVTGGHIAVDLFFIISGFLIAASYERSTSVASFMRKRVFRIYPAFIVAMVLGLVVVLPAGGGHMTATSMGSRALDFIVQTFRLREFAYQAAFQGNPTPGPVNGSVWSIQYEFWCYIGVAILGLTGLLRSNRILVTIFVVSIVISVLFAIFKWMPGGKSLGVIFGYPPLWARLLPMYMAGVVFYRLRHRLELKGSWIVVAGGLIVVAAVLPYGWSILFPIAGAYLILVLAFHSAIPLNNWGRFGDFSYGTYLYAFPVEQLTMRLIGHPVPPWVLFSVAAPVSLMCAFMSWHLVEKRFLRRPVRPVHVPALP
jgi:peptidoglycan/LPS O-acetylase OafA/YrhL